MVKQPESRPGAFTHRQLGLNFKETIGLVVLAIGVDGAIEKLSARITLWPDFQTTVGYGVVLGGVTGFIPDGIVPYGGVERIELILEG